MSISELPLKFAFNIIHKMISYLTVTQSQKRAKDKPLNLFFQAEDGIRDRSPSRGLGDVYKRQEHPTF